jgi:hypothetical protein
MDSSIVKTVERKEFFHQYSMKDCVASGSGVTGQGVSSSGYSGIPLNQDTSQLTYQQF